MKVSSLVVVFLSAGLAGCQALGPGFAGLSFSPPPPAEDPQQAVLRKISEASALAVNAQRELALVADARAQGEFKARKRLLSDLVSYDYYGDVEQLLRDIAGKYEYEFQVFGRRPPEGVLVNVFVRDRPVLEVLKHIGMQTRRVDIKVTKRLIELHYPEAHRP